MADGSSGGRLFKEITVWRRVDEATLMRYRCLQVLPANRYVVKSADFCRLPLSPEQGRQQDHYYLESLFEDGLVAAAADSYETLEEAIARHDQDFGNLTDS